MCHWNHRQNGRSLAASLDETGQVTMMWNAISRFRLALPVMAMLLMAYAGVSWGQAVEPSAAGLWQKIEDGKPVGWFLVVDHDGIFEGAIAKTFPLPGEDPNFICSKC